MKVIHIVATIVLALFAVLALSLWLGCVVVVHAIGLTGLGAALVGLFATAIIATILFYALVTVAVAKFAKEVGLIGWIKQLLAEIFPR
jgi:hypothetical protein